MIGWLASKAKILGLIAGGAVLLALAVFAALFYRECAKTEKLAAQLREERFAGEYKDLLIGNLKDAQANTRALMAEMEAALDEVRQSASQRAEIMEQAKPAAPQGTRKVVDDATRKKVAMRLNRPLP